MEINDLIKFEKDTNIANSLKGMLEKEGFSTENSSDVFEQFFSYKTSYSKFDHGIMAGRIVSKAYLCIQKYIDEWRQKKIMASEDYGNIISTGIIEAVYAIFVHNIYVEEYGKLFGNSPVHNLLINPFSYFGMFCDNLQVWDRSKAINHGCVDWKGNTLYGEDIAINLDGRTIEIICRTDDIRQSFFKLKEGLEEYLEEADKLIKLVLCES